MLAEDYVSDSHTLRGLQIGFAGVAAVEGGFENGSRVAADATALTTNIHSPTDSALLLDVICVSTRLQVFAAENFVDVFFVDVA